MNKHIATPPPQKNSSSTKPKSSFKSTWDKIWSDPKFVSTLITALITAFVTGMIAIIVALIEHPPQTTPAVSIPANPLANQPIVQSCLFDFFDPTFLPIYDLTLGLSKTFTPTAEFTSPFALKFYNQGQNIGGMKLSYLPTSDEFEIIDHINGFCLSLFQDGEQHFLKNREDYPFAYESKNYLFTAYYDLTTDQLEVKLVSNP